MSGLTRRAHTITVASGLTGEKTDVRMTSVVPVRRKKSSFIQHMKQLVVASLLGFLAVSAAADVTTQWVQDSYSGFDVLFTGTGFDSLPTGGSGWQATVTSPSGLWQLDTLNFATYKTDPAYSAFPLEVFNRGTMTFLGQLPVTLDPSPSPGDNILQVKAYDDYFAASAPIQDGTHWFGCFLVSQGWQGYNPITIDSLPVVTDPTTWTWTAEYVAAGPSLAPIPEPGSVLLLGAGCLGLLGLRRSVRRF